MANSSDGARGARAEFPLPPGGKEKIVAEGSPLTYPSLSNVMPPPGADGKVTLEDVQATYTVRRLPVFLCNA